MNPSNPQLDQLIQEFQEEYGTCLNWIFQELNQPENLGYSEDLMKTFSFTGLSPYKGPTPNILQVTFWFWNGPKFIDKNAKQIQKFRNRIRMNKLALENLPYSTYYDFLGSFKFHSMMGSKISFSSFRFFYYFLERLYYVSFNRKLTFEDALHIYFSGITEKIILGLDKFDKLDDTPEPRREFFQKLEKTRPNDKTRQFQDKSRKIIETVLSQYKHYLSQGYFERNILDLLAASSAASNDRTNVTIEDYITAYITYYKILNTDFTKYKCQKELFEDKNHGYLVCESCKSTYELSRDEKPEDFSNKCDCGGKLKYVKYLNDDEHMKWKPVTINTAIITIILISTYYLVNMIYICILVILMLIMVITVLDMPKEYEKRGLILGSSIVITLSYIISSIIINYISGLNETILTYLLLFPLIILGINMIIILILKHHKSNMKLS